MERLFFRKVEVWVVALLLVLALVGTVLFGIVVRNRALGFDRFGIVGDAAYAIASIPQTLRQWRRTDPMRAREGDSRFAGLSGWQADAKPLPGYLLLSRYDGDRRGHTVELVDLSDRSTLFKWELDAGALFEGLEPGPNYGAGSKITTDRFRAIHPLAFENGDLLVKDHSSPAARVSPCGDRVWANPRIFHHSAEFGPDGDIWIPAIIFPATLGWNGGDLNDDSIVRLSVDGEVLEEHSVARVLIDNGYEWLLAGMTGAKDDDPIHLNDIQPVMQDGTLWRRGDLLVSIRHRSTVFLFRPSTGQVLWLRSGPWLFQHDVDVVGDGRIAVFDNAMNPSLLPVPEGRVNSLIIADLVTGDIGRQLPEAFKAEAIRTVHEGLADQLPGGGLLVEEENFGRIVIMDATGGVMAEYINGAGDGMVYRLGWSRYLSQEDGDALRTALGSVSCNG